MPGSTQTDSGSTGTGPTSTGPTSTGRTSRWANSVRLWHRILVDGIAESRWLRGRSGKDAAWFHYERHARASSQAADRHARARTRAQRLASHGSHRVLRRWQAAIERVMERQGQ